MKKPIKENIYMPTRYTDWYIKQCDDVELEQLCEDLTTAMNVYRTIYGLWSQKMLNLVTKCESEKLERKKVQLGASY